MKDVFGNIANEYDMHRRQLIPCFDDFYSLPVQFMDFEGDNPKVLDIGSGTGLFASALLGKYPNAQITLIDLSDKMLEIARKRFAEYPDFKFIEADYINYEFSGQFDIIISALSIHHLTPHQKENLYKKCFDLLSENGIFVNADQVLSPYPEVEKVFCELWKHSIQESGLSLKEVREAVERTSYDNPSTLEEQLKWLRDAGFKYADCIYKYCHFCVMYAKK
jgi:tRNA (cmo5U34)-methyltransferase